MRQSNAQKQRRYRVRKALAVKAERWGAEIVDVIAICKDGKIVLYDSDSGKLIVSVEVSE